MEIGRYGVLARSHHVNLVRHHIRNVLRNTHDEGVVCHEACVQDGFLVIEQQLLYAAEILADKAYLALHIGFRQKRVS